MFRKSINLAKRFHKLASHYGVADGARTCRQISFGGGLDRVTLGGIAHPLELRPGTTDVGAFEQVFVHREYDFEVPFEVRAILDGGANVGLSSVYFANRFPDASIVAVESDAENFAILSKNVELYPNIQPLHAGIWFEETMLSLADQGTGEWGMMVTDKQDGAGGDTPGLTITAIMERAGFETIDLLKLDIESAEKEVFGSGYESWLPRTRLFVIELHDYVRKGCSKAVFGAVARYDFSMTMRGENLIFINDDPSLRG